MPSQFCKQCNSCLRLTYHGRNQDEIDTGTVVARANASINDSVRRKCSCSRRAHRVSAISPPWEAWFRRRVLSNITNNSRGHLLLLKRGVRAVARSLTNKEGEPLAFTTTKGITLDTADVTVPSSLRGVIEGSSAVIFASSASKQGGSAKAVDYEGVINVAKACLEAKVPRLVVVSSGGVASPDSSIYKFLNLFGEIMSWKIRGEDELRSMYAAQGAGAACHYTIVRPGGLTLDPPRGVTAIELNQGDTKSGRIARSDVARVCVESIYSSKSEDCTLECYYKDTGKTLEAVGLSNILKKTDGGVQHLGTESTGDSWDAIFSGLKRDA